LTIITTEIKSVFIPSSNSAAKEALNPEKIQEVILDIFRKELLNQGMEPEMVEWTLNQYKEAKKNDPDITFPEFLKILTKVINTIHNEQKK